MFSAFEGEKSTQFPPCTFSSIRWFEGFREKPGCQLNYQRVHVTGAPRLRDWSPPGTRGAVLV